METEALAEFVTGRPDRLTGAGLRLVRTALGHSEHELAVDLETAERQIYDLETGREAVIPELLDVKLRRLFQQRSTNSSD